MDTTVAPVSTKKGGPKSETADLADYPDDATDTNSAKDEKLAKEQKKKEKASAHGSKSVMGYYIP